MNKYLQGTLILMAGVGAILLYFNQSPSPEDSVIETAPTQDEKNLTAKQPEQKYERPHSVIYGAVVDGKYVNAKYKFNFVIPDGWALQGESEYEGGDLFRAYFTAPGFVEKAFPNADFILSVSVTDTTFDKAYANLTANVTKESEEKILVAGRDSIKRIGRHEFNGYLVNVLIPNGNSSIDLILRTNEGPYVSQYEALLDSFEFTN